MTPPGFAHLLDQARAAHAGSADLQAFCDFPTDLRALDLSPTHFPCADLLAQETGLFGEPFAALRDAFVAAGPEAEWRETYRDTDIGADFMDRFGCYCLIGPGGAYDSAQMRAYVVYMPPNLWYPWHHHPAEELYLVIGGEGEFHRQGHAAQTLRAGQSAFHASNQPHALRTHDHPVMSYVLWRNEFDTAPVWSEPVP